MTTANAVIDARLVDTLIALGIESDEITPDSMLRADLDIDSAELVEIVATIRGGAPDGKALKPVRTVAQLSEFLTR
jgi:hypothetical protein